MTHVNYIGLLGAALAILTFFLTYQRLRNAGGIVKMKWILIYAILSLPAISYVVYYLHILPETELYYEFRSLIGTELLVLFAGGLAGAIATLLPRLVLVIPLSGLGIFVLVPFLKPIVMPVPGGMGKESWNGSVCLQSTPSTCGPASIATIAKSFDVEVSEKEMANSAYTSQTGTEAWYLARGIRRKGFKVDFHIEEGFKSDMDFPVVAGVRLGSLGHFIPILEKQGNLYRIGDPGYGEEVVNEKELLRRYEFTGFYMEISKR